MKKFYKFVWIILLIIFIIAILLYLNSSQKMVRNNINSSLQSGVNNVMDHEYKNRDKSTKNNNEMKNLDKEPEVTELVGFYDTKSDLNIKPVDPKTDPANQIN